VLRPTRSLSLIAFSDIISYLQKPNLCGSDVHENSLRIVASLFVFSNTHFTYDNLCGGQRKHLWSVSRTRVRSRFFVRFMWHG